MQGPLEQRILTECLRSQRPYPTKIANAPELRQGLELFYVAFMDLTADRASGFSIGRIPWSVMNRYARAQHLSEEQTDDLIYYVQAMDTAFVEHHEAKGKKGK